MGGERSVTQEENAAWRSWRKQVAMTEKVMRDKTENSDSNTSSLHSSPD